jgi:hypothetical protein
MVQKIGKMTIWCLGLWQFIGIWQLFGALPLSYPLNCFSLTVSGLLGVLWTTVDDWTICDEWAHRYAKGHMSALRDRVHSWFCLFAGPAQGQQSWFNGPQAWRATQQPCF